jgi:integrase
MAGKSERRKRNSGSIYQRASDGMWVAAIPLPAGPNGQRRRKVIVRAKYADAVKELQKVRQKLDKAGDLSTSSPTLSSWLDTWWERYSERLKVSTRPSYRSTINNYIRPALGHVRLEQLGPAQVARLRDYIVKDKGLSSTTALNAHRVLSVILRDAEREGKIGRNPCSLIDAPSKAVHRVKYLDSGQARDLLAALDPGDGTVPLDLAMAATALLIGPRAGERIGLTRDEINLDTGAVTIAWQLQRLYFEHGCGERKGDAWPCGRTKGGYCPQRHLDIPDSQEAQHLEGGLYLTRPKSRAGWREFTAPPLLIETWRAYLEDHEPGMAGLIFTRDQGRPIDPTEDNSWWDRILREAGLPDVNRHSARHTCNTILTELGYPVDVRQKIVGHASRAVNEQVYTHTSDARVAEATAALGAAMDWRQS